MSMWNYNVTIYNEYDTKNYNASHGGLDKNKDRWKDEVKKSKQYDSCSNTCMYNDCYTGTC